jgi:hypothetical protein
MRDIDYQYQLCHLFVLLCRLFAFIAYIRLPENGLIFYSAFFVFPSYLLRTSFGVPLLFSEQDTKKTQTKPLKASWPVATTNYGRKTPA